MKESAILSLTTFAMMLVVGTALAADQPAQAPQTPGATAVTSPAFAPVDAGNGAQSDLNLQGYKLVWSDEFDAVSWTHVSPKDPAKWFSYPSVHGKYIGFEVHDDESMTIKDGVLVNTLSFKPEADVAGSHCAGPLGMKSDDGKELISTGTLGQAVKEDKRLTWGDSGWIGMKFTTPAGGLTISELGFYNTAGNTDQHEIRIFDGDTRDDVAKTIVNLKGQPEGWVYAPILGGKKTLAGNHTYYLMYLTFWQKQRHDSWYNGETTVTAADGITVSESEWGNWHAGSLFSIDPTGAGFTQQYGYWEARVKMPAGGVGLWPSFCLYTAPSKKSPLDEEVDIFEEYGAAYDGNKDGGFGMRNGNWGKGPKEGHANVWPQVSKPWLDWHIYGFLATPKKCAFFVDGIKRDEFDTPTDYLNGPMYMTLEYNIGGGWQLSGVVANSHMDVDWVRVWALPEK